jgi:hypothetical protein
VRLWSSVDGAPVFVADVPPWHPLAVLAQTTGSAALLAPAAGLLTAVAIWGVVRPLRAGRAWLAAACIAAGAFVGLLPPGDALAVLGIASSLAALEQFARRPSRARWGVAVALIALAILGTAADRFRWLFLIALWFPFARIRRSGSYGALAGALAATVIAALLTAAWWAPARALATRPESGGTPLSPRARSLPPFLSVPRHIVIRDPERAATAVRAVRDLRALAVIDHVPAKVLSMAGGPLSNDHPVREVRVESSGDGNASLRLAGGGWALLVTKEPWWPGWRAYWNGARIPPVLANAASVGVFVPPGDGRLTLRYRPDAFDDGLRAAAVGLLLGSITLVWPWFLAIRERERTHARAPHLPPGGAALLRALPAAARAASWLALAAYAAFLLRNASAIAGGSDSSGYMNHAKLLLSGDRVVTMTLPLELRVPPEDFFRFVPLGFAPGPRAGTMVPSYPPGIPMHLVLLRIVGGAWALRLLAPLAGIAAVVLMFLLAREIGLGNGFAFAGALILGLYATFVMHAVTVMSDVVATAWSLAAMIAALRSRRGPWWWGAVAGAALGVSILVRPTQVLLLPALAVAVGFRWRTLLGIAVAAAPFAALQAATGSALWGGPLRTGYGSFASLVSLDFFAARFVHYATWLAALLSPLVFPLGLAGVASGFAERRTRIVMALWFAPFFLFYCFYGPYETWWYTRFLLPATPAAIVLALLAARSAAERVSPPERRPLLQVMLLAVVLVEGWHLAGKKPWELGRSEAIYPRGVAMAAENLPPRPIVVGMQLSGAFAYYREETMLRWDMLTPTDFERLRAHAALAGRPWYALLGDHEVADAFSRAPGRWREVARVRDIALYALQLE